MIHDYYVKGIVILKKKKWLNLLKKVGNLLRRYHIQVSASNEDVKGLIPNLHKPS